MGKGGSQPWNKSQWMNLIVEVFKWPQALRRLFLPTTVASDWVTETPNLWQRKEAVSVCFCCIRTAKRSTKVGCVHSARECEPPMVHGCIILRTLTVIWSVVHSRLRSQCLLSLKFYSQPCMCIMDERFDSHVTTFFPLSSRLYLQVLLGRASSLNKISVHRMFEARYRVPDMSLFKNERSLVMWQKWSGSVEREKSPNSCTMEHCVPGSVTVGVKTVIWLTCVLAPDCQETEKRTCLLIFPAASSSHLPLFLAFL